MGETKKIHLPKELLKCRKPEVLWEEIVERLNEYNSSRNESRGELLHEIQILTNRISGIRAERTERKLFGLQILVIILAVIQVWQSCARPAVPKTVDDGCAQSIDVRSAR